MSSDQRHAPCLGVLAAILAVLMAVVLAGQNRHHARPAGVTDLVGRGLYAYGYGLSHADRSAGTAPIGTTTTLSYGLGKLTSGATYRFTVVARDKAGNRPAPSTPLVITVPIAGGCKARHGSCAVP